MRKARIIEVKPGIVQLQDSIGRWIVHTAYGDNPTLAHTTRQDADAYLRQVAGELNVEIEQ